MVEFLAIQVRLGRISINDVPARLREAVDALIDQSRGD